MKEKQFFKEINVFRGIVILFVVIGHSFDYTSNPTILGFLKSLAYSFHMPAFFFISGFLFTNVNMSFKRKIDLIKKKTVRLMIPYLFLTLVTIGLKIIFANYARNPLNYTTLLLDVLIGRNNPNGGLWFLYALYATSIFAILVSGIKESLFFIIGIAGFLLNRCVFNMTGHIGAFGLNYTMYYAFGMLVRANYQTVQIKILDKIKNKIWVSSILVIIYAVIVYIQTYFNKIPISVLIPYLGTVVFFVMAYFISNKNENNFLSFIGDWGMDIYMIGYYVQQSIYVLLGKVLQWDYYIYSWLMMVMGILIPVIISKMFVRRSKILSILILGRK